MSKKNSVTSPLRYTEIYACSFPASGSSTTSDYVWNTGFSGSSATRNDSGSFTLTLDEGNILYGVATATLQLPDDTADDANCYRLSTTNVFLAASGTLDVNVLSGSLHSVRHDCPNGEIHVVVVATRANKQNTP